MKKLLLIVVLLVLVGGGGLVWFGLDPIVKRLQPTLLAIAAEHLNQPVEAKAIHVSVLPDITIDLEDLTIGQPAAPAGHVPKIKLKTSIAKLLSTPVGITGITVDQPEIKLTRKGDGSIALGDFVLAAGKAKKSGEGPAGSASKKPAGTDPSAKKEVAFNLTEGGIENGKIHFIDQVVSPNQTITVSDLNVSVSNLGSGDAPFSLSAGLFGEKNIALDGKINISQTTNGLPHGSGKLKISSLALAEMVKTAGVYGIKLPGELKNSLALEAAFSNSAAGFVGGFGLDLTSTGITILPAIKKDPAVQLKLKFDATGPSPSSLQTNSLNLTLDGSELTAKFSPSPNDPLSGSLALTSSEFKLAALKRLLTAAEQYNLDGSIKLDLKLAGMKLSSPGMPAEAAGSINFENVSARIPFKGEQKAEKREGELAAEAAPAETSLPIEGLNGQIKLEGKKITAKGITVKAAGQPIELNADLTGLPSPDTAFDIKSAKLELEPLARSTMAKPPTALIGAALDNLKVNGTYSTAKKTGNINIDFNGGTAAKLPLGATKLVLALAPGLTELKPSELAIFGGSIQFFGTIRGEEKKALDFTLSGSGFALEPVTKFGNPDRTFYLIGNVDSINARAESADLSDSNALRAAVKMVAGKGSLEGINIIGSTLGKVGQIPGINWTIESLVPEEHRHILQGNSTAFDSLTADVSVSGPTTTIHSAALLHPLYLVTGGGTITGDDYSLDLQLKMTPSLTSGMTGKEPKLKLLFDPAGNLQIPVRIVRKAGIVLVYPDVSLLIKGAAVNTAKEAAGRVLDKVAPGLGGAKDALDMLFK